nr:PREDICTED: E3 ubiquitin-protein ligase FANCL [Linepithema humile]XP_012215664.1 PREDICTED: E3 ubiquitin-protein ligase FANCL [Linepithema humile]
MLIIFLYIIVKSAIYNKLLIMAMKRTCNNNEFFLKWHPEMILVSDSPITWQGFLLISHASCEPHDIQCSRVKLKLILPNYPSFRNVQIRFGKQIAFLRNIEFRQKVKALLMNSTQTVPLFLRQLQSLIGEYMHKADSKLCMIDLDATSNFLKDLKTALQNSSDVQLTCNHNLNMITLSLRGISLKLQRCNSIEVPWKVISSDLPNVSIFEGFEKNITNLSITMVKFKWQVELLENAWKQLKEIDENCWVIDPLEPNKSHMYRRIHLSQSISVTITIQDLLHPTALPVIKFFGSDNEVKKQINYVSDNMHNWNKDRSILENLRMLLNMYEFPEPQENLEDKKAIIGSHECGICFSADELPDKICNNKKCMKHFHSTCLSKWLQTNARNQVVFNHIHGACPHCKENISCFIE